MRFFALFVLGTVACTSSSDGGAVSGDPPGGGFDVEDQISATVTTSDGTGDDTSEARIVIASTPNLCSDAAGSIDRKGQRSITIELRDVSGATKTAPTAPGSYTIYPNTGSEPAKSASLTVGALDDTCQLVDDDSASAQSGTVTLTSVAGGAFTGSFDVTLNTGGHLAGTFAPTACPQLATALASADHVCR